MELSAWLLLLLLIPILTALLCMVAYLSLRLGQANRRLAELHVALEDHRRLTLAHLERLEDQLLPMQDLGFAWDSVASEWEFKGQLGAEGLIAYLATCRSFAQASLLEGEDRNRVDALVGSALQRLISKDAGCREQLSKLLTDEEQVRWLNHPRGVNEA